MNSSLRDVTLYAATVESLQVDLYCDVDPTGTAPAFAVTAEGTVVGGSDTYTNGTWGTYGSDGWTTARTPTFGTTASIPVTSGSRLWLWAKCTAGSEVAVQRVGLIIVP